MEQQFYRPSQNDDTIAFIFDNCLKPFGSPSKKPRGIGTSFVRCTMPVCQQHQTRLRQYMTVAGR
jgi:hypothetical protein